MHCRFVRKFIFFFIALSFFGIFPLQKVRAAEPKLSINKYYFRSDPIQYQSNRLYVLIKSQDTDFEGIVSITSYDGISSKKIIDNRPISIISNHDAGLFVDIDLNYGGEIKLSVSVTNNDSTPISVSNHTATFAVSFDTDKDGIPNQIDDDDDNDGISDADEIAKGTSPTNPDSDGDGISDLYDIFPTSPDESHDSDNDGIGDNADLDDDNDGISDIEEIALGTNPKDKDSDQDGISDAVELAQGTSPTNKDTDNDGVNDLEDPAPTDPTRSKDSDKDGLADEDEISNGLNPYDGSDAMQDNDKDGISNSDEIKLYRTNPNEKDTDQDSLPDGFEIKNGLNPTDKTDAIGDKDNDGISNLTEYKLGSNIANPNTLFFPDRVTFQIIPILVVLLTLIFLAVKIRKRFTTKF